MARVISRQKRDPWADALNNVGSFASGFAGGYMGNEGLKENKANSAAMRDYTGTMTEHLKKQMQAMDSAQARAGLNGAFGENGEGINPNPSPIAGGAAPPVQFGQGAMPMNTNWLEMMLRGMGSGSMGSPFGG